jgi:hypothetical protein
MSKSRPWLVMCCDLSRPADHQVRWCACRADAVLEARQRNRLAIAQAGGDARCAPLYYCQPAGHDWGSRADFHALYLSRAKEGLSD